MPKKKGPYLFKMGKPSSKAAKVKLPHIGPEAGPIEPQDDPGPPYTVKGKVADSREEWIVSLALDKMDLDYYFQFAVAGGRSRPGGQVLDFLVDTPGMKTPLYENGVYWHTGTFDDEQALYDMKQMLQQMGILAKEPEIIWDYECQTVDNALGVLRERLSA